MSSSPKNNIQNLECYNSEINENYYDIYNKYVLIIIDYFKHCHDNMCIQNEQYKKSFRVGWYLYNYATYPVRSNNILMLQ